MTLPAYGQYKNSGIEWLGDMPAHWEVRRTKFLFDLMSRPAGEDDGIVTAFRDGQVTLRSNRRIDGFTNAVKEIGYQGVRCGDLVIHAMDAFAGAIGVSDSDGKSTPVYSVCKPKDGVSNPHFYAHLLRYMAVGGFINSLAKGIRERSTDFRWTDAGALFLPLPKVEEQNAVVAFLDRETAKINALIAEQEKLLALLDEKRQATISHAVTRGLDPSAPMKDSGVPWLGDVPSHWDATPLKYISRIGNGSTPSRDNPDYWTDVGFPWLNSSVVNQEEVTEAQQFVTQLALDECHLPIVRPPAVLVGITGQGKTRGMAAPLMFETTVNQHLAYVKPSEDRLFVSYLLRALEMAYEHLRTESDSAGSTKGAITCDQLSRLSIPMPPLEEQKAIATFLDIEAGKFDRLRHEADRAIALLEERRNALISAAVTGKIDVRDAVLREAVAA